MTRWTVVLLTAALTAGVLAGCGRDADYDEYFPEEEFEEDAEYSDEDFYSDDDYVDEYPEEGESSKEEETEVYENGEAADQGDTGVQADFFADVKDRYPNYIKASESVNVDSSDYVNQPVILFHTDGNAEDFRVYSIETNIGNDGRADYIPTEVFHAGELTKDAPVAVTLDFPGDFSVNGFSYKGSDGNVKTFIISLSGEDGSLVITPESFPVPGQ